MGAKSRSKGAGHEREVACELSLILGLPLERGARSGVEGGEDVMGWPGVRIECKRRKSLSVMAWMNQAVRDAGDDLPIVVMRGDRGENVMLLRLKDLPRLAERFAAAIRRPVYPGSEFQEPELLITDLGAQAIEDKEMH